MAKMVKGVEIDNWGSALIATVILGFVNAFVRPVMVFLTIPSRIPDSVLSKVKYLYLKGARRCQTQLHQMV
jgi:uncharacterized membrane protein YvlD (DUF360 family)